MDTYGLIGWPVKHSLSPVIHNAAFKALGIDAEYRLFEVAPEKLEDFLLNNKNVIGFNVTIPYKVRAREILEEKFPFDKKSSFMLQELYYVKLSGAVNTVKRSGDRLEYWNTDAAGFLEALEKDLMFDIKKRNVVLIGCGGAGRAIIASLAWKKTKIEKIYVYDINDETISSTKAHFLTLPQDWRANLDKKVEFIAKREIPDRIKASQLLINASNVGMREGEDDSIVDKRFLHKDLYIYDVVYNRKTRLVKDAELLGLPAKGGLSMLLYQGAKSFELWTEKKAPIEIMKKALLEKL